MQITFQNKPSDLDALYDYLLKETREGKQLGKRVFYSRQFGVLLVIVLLTVSVWGILGHLRVSFGLSSVISLGFFIFMLFVAESIIFLIAGFKPFYSSGKEAYENERKKLTPRELEILQLACTLIIDDECLELRNSEAVHRWSWQRIDRIGITPSFIFIHFGNFPHLFVPQRDFSSEQSFIEFGKRLIELREKYKIRSIGAQYEVPK